MAEECRGCERVEAEWAVHVVPEGSFLALVAEHPLTMHDVLALKEQVPSALQDRVVILTGFRVVR